jgi:hypothetical protein
LMPKKVRRCLRFPVLVAELARFPLFEELALRPVEKASGAELQAVGAQLMRSVASRSTAWEAQALLHDALEDALGETEAQRLLTTAPAGADFDAQPLALAALGGIVTNVASTLAQLKSLDDIVPHKTFEASAAMGARTALKQLLGQRREQIKVADEWLSRVERPLLSTAPRG